MTEYAVHPDLAGFPDLAHAFDLEASALERATLEAAPGRIEREAIPPIPEEIAALMHDGSRDGKPVESSPGQ